jgi:hypothetical protein
MRINRHSQVTTTPKIRAATQASDKPARVLAKQFGATEQTVWKWRKRDSVNGRNHTAHRLQTTLITAQEAVAVSLGKTLFVPLDDLLAAVRGFLNPKISPCGLVDRCPRRHGVGALRKRAQSGKHEFDKLCHRTEHRTPTGPARITANQRYGRAVQGAYRRCAAKPLLPIWRRAGSHAASIRPALQPTASAISLGQQDAVASDNGLAQTHTGTVQKTAILPSGM